MNNYITLYDGLPYDKAMLKARKVQTDEAKLRKLGGIGNYSDVQIRLSFDGPGRKTYRVIVAPLADTMKEVVGPHFCPECNYLCICMVQDREDCHHCFIFESEK